MADSVDWNVVLRLALQGASQTKQGLTEVQGAVDRLHKDGKIGEKQWEANSRAISRAGTTARTASVDHKNLNTSLISQRYALYDVAQTYGAYSAAVTAAGVATVTAFASQERAFTNVERTADGALGNIREALYDLSTTIPKSFNELAEIATLGNQLGVASQDIEAFTSTIAQFSTVTGITADASAQAFGKLGNLLNVSAQDYDRLASSITLVGRTSAATEQQIISVAGEIAPAAAAAGFAADEVIGLSGALSSLRVPPERSRSTILQFFETLNTAVANGGKDLENFAQVVGVTSSELDAMVRGGQGQDILSRFISATAASDTIEVTQALQELGLAGLRTNPTIRALAGNTQLMAQALGDSRQGWTENTELQRQMAMILDDLSTKFETTVNAVVNFASAIGGQLAPVIGPLLDTLKNVTVALTDFANTDIGGSLVRLIGIIAAVTAGYAAYRTFTALATAATYALITAHRGLAASGATTALGQMIAGFRQLKNGTDAATTSTFNLRGALLALGRVTVILAIFQGLSELVFNFGGSMKAIQPVLNFTIDRLFDLGAAAVTVARAVSDAIAILPGSMGKAAKSAAGSLKFFQNNLDAIRKTTQGRFNGWVDGLQETEESAYSAGAALGDLAGGAELAAGNLDGLGGAADSAAAKVYTLVDYASDLSSVWSRAFEIRFGPQSTLDQITTSFMNIRKATEEASRSIGRLKAEMSGISSDISIQEYFLGIAQQYGDAKRVTAIQATLAKLQADLADKTAELRTQQDAQSKTLEGNSFAAIQNRDQLRNLTTQYQSHIQALASSGLTQDQLAAATEQLRQDFIAQATQLGYNRAELGTYEQAFYDVKAAIDNVPRSLTVDADTDPATIALNEFAARAQTQMQGLGQSLGNAIGNGLGSGVVNGINQGIEKWRMSSRPDLGPSLPGSRARPGGGSFAEGGYTGAGGKYEPAGVVHRGEYVVPKRHVDQRTGLPRADALGRLSRGATSSRGYANGGFVGGGGNGLPTMVGLLPMTIQQIAQAVQPHLILNGREISQSTSSEFARGTAVGAG